MAIRVVSTTTVEANGSHEPRKKKIDLTSSDLKLLLVGSIQKGILFPKPKFDHQTLIRNLKTSFSRTLDFFFPLAGRLATVEHEDDTISFFIDCNNAGAQFVEAVAENVTISDILEPIYVPPIVHSFFPLSKIKNYEDVSNPLLAVQVTELEDGIFIGCTINHLAADGTTFWNFFNSWSEISLGFHQISKNPVFEHWFRSGSNCSIRLPLSLVNTEDVFTLPPLKERVFRFSKEKIAGLKAKANAEAGVNSISSLQSLLAHLWRSVIRNRQIEPEMETNFFLQIGIRTRLQPQIPDEYFGNAVQGGTVTLKAREITENGLGYVALQMNKLVVCYTEEKARNSLDSWIKDPKLLTISGSTRDYLMVSSSPRFNVYGNDFGWAKPIAVRSGPGNKFDGKITVFPGVEEGSIDIEVCVLPEVLQGMGSDSEFMDAVTI